MRLQNNKISLVLCQSGLFSITMKLFVTLGVLSLLVSVANGGVSMDNPFSCYSTDTIRSVTSIMGQITSYEAIRHLSLTTVNPYNSNSTCAPSRFWYLGRYGARFPALATLQRMIDFAESSVQNDIVSNYELGRTSLCRVDFEAIRDFDKETAFGTPFTTENVSMVMESGVIAMQNIARRFQQQFPDILGQNYSSDLFHFRHTSIQWTNASIRAFASGLFGETGSETVFYEEIPHFDWFLNPIPNCPAFSEEIANSSAVPNAFAEGPEIEEMIAQINKRLGFHSSNPLTLQQIDTIWNWCRFPTAALFETSNSEIGGIAPWCAAFSVVNHRIMEYWRDLGYFYSSGHGVRNRRLHENLSCGVMQDLLTHMQSNNNKKARIFVTGSPVVLGMLVLLGSFRDEWPLHQHNFAQQSTRNWILSLISSFSQNLAVVRYDCDDGDDDLIFLFNEMPLLVPGCDQQTGVCKLSFIVNRFRRFIDANCEVSFCSMD